MGKKESQGPEQASLHSSFNLSTPFPFHRPPLLSPAMQTLRAARSSLTVRSVVKPRMPAKTEQPSRCAVRARGWRMPFAFSLFLLSSSSCSIEFEQEEREREKNISSPRRNHLFHSSSALPIPRTIVPRKDAPEGGAVFAENGASRPKKQRLSFAFFFPSKKKVASSPFSFFLRQPLGEISPFFFRASPSLWPPHRPNPLQVRASADKPAPVAAVPKVKQALAAAALAIAVGVTATPAFADVSGLTPCSQSKQYASRQKKEVKALQKRLKQV